MLRIIADTQSDALFVVAQIIEQTEDVYDRAVKRPKFGHVTFQCRSSPEYLYGEDGQIVYLRGECKSYDLSAMKIPKCRWEEVKNALVEFGATIEDGPIMLEKAFRVSILHEKGMAENLNIAGLKKILDKTFPLYKTVISKSD